MKRDRFIIQGSKSKIIFPANTAPTMFRKQYSHTNHPTYPQPKSTLWETGINLLVITQREHFL